MLLCNGNLHFLTVDQKKMHLVPFITWSITAPVRTVANVFSGSGRFYNPDDVISV